MNDDDAFRIGYDAYWDGVDPDDNPYAPGSEEDFSWAEGWAKAELEDDEVPNG